MGDYDWPRMLGGGEYSVNIITVTGEVREKIYTTKESLFEQAYADIKTDVIAPIAVVIMPGLLMLVDEEAPMKGKQHNTTASVLVGQPIYGTVVIVPKKVYK